LTVFLDNGFSNFGVRPTTEDLGRGGEVNGCPLSCARQGVVEFYDRRRSIRDDNPFLFELDRNLAREESPRPL